jgi:hypothetical protein
MTEGRGLEPVGVQLGKSDEIVTMNGWRPMAEDSASRPKASIAMRPGFPAARPGPTHPLTLPAKPCTSNPPTSRARRLREPGRVFPLAAAT